VSSLRIRLLGAPQVEIEGGPFKVDTRKAVALLAHLAVTERPHSRDALAALLWPDYDTGSARAALRRTLSTLRKALGGGWLTTARDTVLLEGPVWLDTRWFQELVRSCRDHGHGEAEECERCIGPLSEAVDLCRGEFMEGFSLRDSPEYEEWQSLQAASFRTGLEGVLRRLVRACSEVGSYQTALGHAMRWLALDPLQEAAHASIMRLHAQAGDRSAALRQYRECLRTLDSELGVTPLEETTALYKAIIAGEVARETPRPLPSATLASAPSPGRAAPALPLVGREAELEALTRLLERTGSEGQILAIEGEAGIGKTRLLREALESVQNREGTVLTAQCYEGEESIAFGPIIALLREALATPAARERLESVPDADLLEASRLLPELAHLRATLPPPPPLDPPSARVRLFDAVLSVLVAAAAGEVSGVLVVEDLHWVDEVSLDLISYLARRLRGREACLACTWRSEGVPPDHRLRRLVAELEREGAATHLRLGRLSLEAVSALLRCVPGSQNEPAPAARLHRETEGVPFFIVQYLETLPESGPDGESWNLPGGVADLLRARIGRLGEAERQIVAAGAVIGRSFAFDVLRQASGRSEEEAISAVESLISRGFFQPLAQGGRDAEVDYDFSHEKLRTIAYEDTSLPRRRLLHRRVAEALVRAARGHRERGAAAGQIAHHYQLGREEAEAAEYFKLAGDHARSLYANAEALSHYESALALGHPNAAALHEAIGDLRTMAGDYGEALASYETAAALSDSVRLPCLEQKIGSVYDRRGEWELAERHFAAALEEFGEADRDGERAGLYADWSLTAHRQGSGDRALDLAQQALKLAESIGDAAALAQAHNILGILANSRGDLDGARDHLQRSLALAEDLGDLSAHIAALNNLALAFTASGENEQALSLSETALALCASQGDRHREAALHNNMADLLHAMGRSQEAMEHLKQAVTIFAEIGADAGAMQPEVWKLTAWGGVDPADLKTSVDAVASAVNVERPDLRRHAAPDGTVTILFTDIDGSTAMTERLGDQRWLELLRAHNAIVRELVETHEGFEVKAQGDGFMLAFQSARRALRCAIEVQRAIAAYSNAHPDEPVRVRIGLHAGEAIREADDFFGKNVALAARIANEAQGGQILISSVLKELTESAGEFKFDEGREAELKGLSGTHRLFEVLW
jgi:class 3 adenylate cyclase/DNA-binding SARP family transcriptional activator